MNDSIPPDPYKALGLDKTATPAAIKTAYRKAALKYHPDKTSDAGNIELFHAIQQAYDLLGDEDKRKHYDNTVRMFDLRRELHKDRPPFPSSARTSSGRTTSYSYETREPSAAQTAGWSSRGPSVFEERRPKDMPEPSPSYKDTARDSYFDRPAEFASARKHDTSFEPSPRKQAPPPKAAKAESVRSVKAERSRSDAKKQRERQTDRERRSKYATPGDSYSSDDSGPARPRRTPSSARAPPSSEPRRSRESRQSDSESFDNDRVRKYKNQAEELLRHTGMFGGFSRRAHSPPPSAYKYPETQEPRRNSTGARSGSQVRRSSSSKTRSKESKSASSSRRPSNTAAEYVERERGMPERAPPLFAHTRSAPADIKIPPESSRGRSDARYDAPRFIRSNTMPLSPEPERSRSGPRPVRVESVPMPDRIRTDPRSEPRAAPRTSSRRTDAQPNVSSGLRHHAETHDSGYSTNSPNDPVPPSLGETKGSTYAHRSGSDEYIPTTIREPTSSKSRRSESPTKESSRFPSSLRRDDSYSSTKYIPSSERDRGPPPSRSAYPMDASSIRRPMLSRSNSHSSKTIPTLRTSSSASVPRASPREPDTPRFQSPFKGEPLFGEVYRSRSPDDMSPTSPNSSRERIPRERSYPREGPPSAARRGVPLESVAYVRSYDQGDVAYAGSSGAGLGRRNSVSGHQPVYSTVEPRPSGSRRTSAAGRSNPKVFMLPRREQTSVY